MRTHVHVANKLLRRAIYRPSQQSGTESAHPALVIQFSPARNTESIEIIESIIWETVWHNVPDSAHVRIDTIKYIHYLY